MGWAYTGSAGGPMRTETKTCAKDAVEKVKSKTAIKIQRPARRRFMYFPLASPPLQKSEALLPIRQRVARQVLLEVLAGQRRCQYFVDEGCFQYKHRVACDVAQ